MTYAPDEPALRARLSAETPAGAAWRCLRCGDFVLGAPHGVGPADQAPLVLRGRVLRDALILRLLAVERFGRGLLILLLAYGIWRFSTAQAALSRVFEQYLPLIRPLTDRLGYDLNDSTVVHYIRTVLHARTSTLLWAAVGVAAYGALQLVEGVGLWLLKRWGEYFAVVATSVFLPIEVYELYEKITVLRIVTFVINIAAVLYIALSKRLFGLRGGRRAYDEERRSESLLEVEDAAMDHAASGAASHGT